MAASDDDFSVGETEETPFVSVNGGRSSNLPPATAASNKVVRLLPPRLVLGNIVPSVAASSPPGGTMTPIVAPPAPGQYCNPNANVTRTPTRGPGGRGAPVVSSASPTFPALHLGAAAVGGGLGGLAPASAGGLPPAAAGGRPPQQQLAALQAGTKMMFRQKISEPLAQPTGTCSSTPPPLLFAASSPPSAAAVSPLQLFPPASAPAPPGATSSATKRLYRSPLASLHSTSPPPTGGLVQGLRCQNTSDTTAGEVKIVRTPIQPYVPGATPLVLERPDSSPLGFLGGRSPRQCSVKQQLEVHQEDVNKSTAEERSIQFGGLDLGTSIGLAFGGAAPVPAAGGTSSAQVCSSPAPAPSPWLFVSDPPEDPPGPRARGEGEAFPHMYLEKPGAFAHPAAARKQLNVSTAGRLSISPAAAGGLPPLGGAGLAASPAQVVDGVQLQLPASSSPFQLTTPLDPQNRPLRGTGSERNFEQLQQSGLLVKKRLNEASATYATNAKYLLHYIDDRSPKSRESVARRDLLFDGAGAGPHRGYAAGYPFHSSTAVVPGVNALPSLAHENFAVVGNSINSGAPQGHRSHIGSSSGAVTTHSAVGYYDLELNRRHPEDFLLGGDRSGSGARRFRMGGPGRTGDVVGGRVGHSTTTSADHRDTLLERIDRLQSSAEAFAEKHIFASRTKTRSSGGAQANVAEKPPLRVVEQATKKAHGGGSSVLLQEQYEATLQSISIRRDALLKDLEGALAA
eukprot:CAMPEP_0178993968 /NCGR_PEP_ID=MMETSP0795-20121207/7011_1 /TAXON_ID=88552 /ORGANISM="Amoebophrya sp., Strain Ameob2" /LENGTH=739 /DNA_ID=CAMNT_0020686113 /DNA_START=143 /DNA_END=2362 /DNA_ORIENTATION=+